MLDVKFVRVLSALVISNAFLFAYGTDDEIGAQTYAIRSVEEAISLYDYGILNNERIRLEVAERYLRKNFQDALNSSYVSRMDSFSFISLLSRPWLTSEQSALNAVLSWISENKHKTSLSVIRTIANSVHLGALSLEDLAMRVYDSNLFDRPAILEAFVQKTSFANSSVLHLRYPNQIATDNVITDRMAAKLEGTYCDSGFVLGINDSSMTCAIQGRWALVTLGATFIINRVELVSETKNSKFSVEVSENLSDWQTVGQIDWDEHILRFVDTPVRYIRLSGYGRFSGFSAYYTNRGFYEFPGLLDNELYAEDESTYVFPNVDSALDTYHKAFQEGDNAGIEIAETYLGQHFEQALRSKVLPRIGSTALLHLISKPWIVNEVEVYLAVDRWLQYNGANGGINARRSLLNRIHLGAMTLDQLSAIARNSEHFSTDALLEAFVLKVHPHEDLRPHMRFSNQLADHNVASSKMLATIEGGECTSGFQLGSIKESETCQTDRELIVSLGANFLINRAQISTFGEEWENVYISQDKVWWIKVANVSTSDNFIRFPEAWIRHFKISVQEEHTLLELKGVDLSYEKENW